MLLELFIKRGWFHCAQVVNLSLGLSLLNTRPQMSKHQCNGIIKEIAYMPVVADVCFISADIRLDCSLRSNKCTQKHQSSVCEPISFLHRQGSYKTARLQNQLPCLPLFSWARAGLATSVSLQFSSRNKQRHCVLHQVSEKIFRQAS